MKIYILLPSGRSAHLEGGFMKGAGKYLYIVGDFLPGEFELMYKWADGIYRYTDEDLTRLLNDISKGVSHG